MDVALGRVSVTMRVLVFGTNSVICSNEQFQDLPYLRNCARVSYILTVKVVEGLVAMDGYHDHKNRHI